METKEIQITVPWGHVAGKTWGDDKNIPILVFHGIMDNAASFDRLIPYLPQNYYYICIDLPGHGKSSNFPPFFPYFSINFTLVYQLIMNYFGRKSYTLMGHSYGGQIAISFALLYPERVEKLVLLDIIHFHPVGADEYISKLKARLNHMLKLYEGNGGKSTPAYTYDEILRKFKEGRQLFIGSPISTPAAEALLKRGLTKVDGNKYKFSMDQRLKSFINPAHNIEYITKIYETHPIKCPLLIILGSKMEAEHKTFEPVLDLFKGKENVQVEIVEGGHDVHSDRPEVVGPIVSKFLLTNKSKL